MKPQIINRREFAKRVVVGAASATAAGSVSAADEKPKPQSPDEVGLFLQAIAVRHPDERLTDSVLKAIASDIHYNLMLSAQLSHFPLKNSDEPSPVFAAWRAPSPNSTVTPK